MLFLLLSTALASPPSCASLSAASEGPPTERVGLLRSTMWLGLRFYQVAISPADGAGCTLYPSCSRYTIEAIQRNGPLRGLWLGTARIFSVHAHLEDDVLCSGNGRLFSYRPPAEDEWWRQ